MKKIFLILTLIALVSFHACGTPKAYYKVTVIDADTELPINNAKISVAYLKVFAKGYGKGWGNITKATSVELHTNQDGFCETKGETVKNHKFDISKEGYYKGFIPYNIIDSKTYNKVLNRWEPWPCEVTVKLRKVKEPVEEFYFFRESYFKSPNKNEEIGFDMLKGDWVRPHGKGEVADFTFNMINAKKIDETHLHDIANLTFQTEYDGILDSPSKSIYSSFTWPYTAPLTGYKNLQLFRNYEMVPESRFPQARESNVGDKHSIIRIRTKVDINGKIISAYYGVITNLHFNPMKHTISISYKINPDNKSKSLEFVPYSDKNLFRDRDEQGDLK